MACWGTDFAGVSTPPDGKFVEVSARSSGVYASGLRRTGTVECWGTVSWYEVNADETTPSGRFSTLSVGYRHVCGIRTDGTVECWGSNDYGKWSPPAGSLVSVTRSHRHGCGLREDGTIECWGSDELGQATPPEGFVFTSVTAR